jgi:FtsP/CotA-like multicopper oxidase with cupredoxin domain
MSLHRRLFLRGLLTAAGATSVGIGRADGQHVHPAPRSSAPASPRSDGPSGRVVTPDVPHLPWRLVDGVKEFHLVAEPVKTEFVPGRHVDVWGFNGHMPGPTIEIDEGDRVRFLVHNNLPEPFSMHWHGLEVPIEMDGGPGISQDPIAPGGSFTYEFTINQHGTFFYHSHMAMQELMGMVGFFIVHPRRAATPRVDRDFGVIWQGWALLPNNTIPNTLAMEFNWLTMNGKAGPAATPMIVQVGERVRVRNVNLSMDHHPLHLHGNTFVVTGTEAGRIPEQQWQPGNTVLVGVAQARDFEFVASREGDWMLHCHLPHHMMNQMIPMVGPMVTEHGHGAHGAPAPRPANTGLGQPDPTLVPGFPQDMSITMDEAVEKPETFGLRKGWTAGMMGMMTLIRVVPPALFDRIAERRRALDGRPA